MVCVYLLCRLLVPSVPLSEQKGDQKTRRETGASFKGGFGLKFCCGKGDRVNLCFERISVMAEGDLKKGFEGFDFTSLFHLDW